MRGAFFYGDYENFCKNFVESVDYLKNVCNFADVRLKQQSIMTLEKKIANDILSAYMKSEGDYIRSKFEGLDDAQAMQMAMTLAALMLKNNLQNIAR